MAVTMAPDIFLAMPDESASSPPVAWREDGTPFSPQFDDIYRNAGGGLAQARHVFLGGCSLLPASRSPSAWAGATRWGVLENGFGLGLNFLATRVAWESDPDRPTQLFYTAIEAWPPDASDLVRSAAPYPELQQAAGELAAQWSGLSRGVHRLQFAQGQIQLTLVIAPIRQALRELSGQYDSIYLDGFSPVRNPEMWNSEVIAGIARHANPGARAATWCVARSVRDALAANQFHVERVPGLPPKRQALRASYQPVHVHARPLPMGHVHSAGACAVIGAGLAGAAAAHALARRGWQVTVLDRADYPAAGASAVPAGLFVPHVTPDDDSLARLSRAGIRATLAFARGTLTPNVDYAASGVLERPTPGKRRLPQTWPPESPGFSHGPRSPITQEKVGAASATLDKFHPALWHPQAGWMRPAALVAALLATSSVSFQGKTPIRSVQPEGVRWRLVSDRPLPLFDLVVIAAGLETAALAVAPWLPLHALAGQVAYGAQPLTGSPTFPVNGNGYLIPLPADVGRLGWVSGSTFARDQTHSVQTAAAHAANAAQLAALLPATAAAVARAWGNGSTHAWSGVRATLPDHLPAIGACAPVPRRLGTARTALPIQVLTGLGARGLSLALLCAHILAAQLHAEPLPVSRSLARRLQASRFASH